MPEFVQLVDYDGENAIVGGGESAARVAVAPLARVPLADRLEYLADRRVAQAVEDFAIEFAARLRQFTWEDFQVLREATSGDSATVCAERMGVTRRTYYTRLKKFSARYPQVFMALRDVGARARLARLHKKA